MTSVNDTHSILWKIKHIDTWETNRGNFEATELWYLYNWRIRLVGQLNCVQMKKKLYCAIWSKHKTFFLFDKNMKLTLKLT